MLGLKDRVRRAPQRPTGESQVGAEIKGVDVQRARDGVATIVQVGAIQVDRKSVSPVRDVRLWRAGDGIDGNSVRIGVEDQMEVASDFLAGKCEGKCFCRACGVHLEAAICDHKRDVDGADVEEACQRPPTFDTCKR